MSRRRLRFGARLRRSHWFTKRRTLVDPGANQVDLLGGQRIAVQRHARDIAKAEYPFDQQAVATLAGNDHSPRNAAAQHGGLRIQSELRLRLLGAVALDAVGAENRRDVATEVDRLARRVR